MQLLKKQRDAVGLSVYTNELDFYAPEKGGERHHQMLLNCISNTATKLSESARTKTYEVLHQIAEKLHRRSLIFLFTDMLQPERDSKNLFEALRHLKHNKHELVLFHVYDKATEYSFNFDNSPKRFVDIESGADINVHPEVIKESYESAVEVYFKDLRMTCGKYKINYVDIDIQQGFDKLLTTFLVERKKFI